MTNEAKDYNDIKLELIEKAKQELELLKALLEDKSEKIDISNIYVFNKKDRYYIVRKEENSYRIQDDVWGGYTTRYDSQLEDIFTNKVIFERRRNKTPLYNKFRLEDEDTGKKITATLEHVTEIDRDLLAFIDNQAPLIVLQQLYYNLNSIVLSKNPYVKRLTNTNAPTLQ